MRQLCGEEGGLCSNGRSDRRMSDLWTVWVAAWMKVLQCCFSTDTSERNTVCKEKEFVCKMCSDLFIAYRSYYLITVFTTNIFGWDFLKLLFSVACSEYINC